MQKNAGQRTVYELRGGQVAQDLAPIKKIVLFAQAQHPDQIKVGKWRETRTNAGLEKAQLVMLKDAHLPTTQRQRAHYSGVIVVVR